MVSPDSTPTIVRLFISAVAIPVAEAYQRQHEAETSKLLQRYGGAQQRRGSSDQETDAMAALEKQAQFDELKELGSESAVKAAGCSLHH